MRINTGLIEKIEDLADRVLGAGEVTAADLPIALAHLTRLREEFPGKPEREESWHRWYAVKFGRIGVKCPELSKDFRSFTSAANGRKGGRPKGSLNRKTIERDAVLKHYPNMARG